MEKTMAKQTQKVAGNEVPPPKRVRPQHTDFMRDGKEYPDPTPVAPPVGFIKQPTMAETMRAMIHSHALRQAALNSGHETFEEADDFDVGDDYDPTSPYEEVFEPPAPTPNLAEDIAVAIKKQFTEETPSANQPPEATPTEAPPTPPQAAPQAAPQNPIQSFFKK